MSQVKARSPELRVLLRMVTAKDGAMVTRVLARVGIEAESCADAAELAREMAVGAAAVLIAEEILADQGFGRVMLALRAQPAWSDVPVIVVARSGVESIAITDALEQLANLTVLERPMRVSSLVSTVRTALAARRRQYQLRATLEGLREADQRKTEFLATLAHELRNPLAPLRTSLNILAEKQPDEATAQRLYAMMDRQVTHMVRLIDDLMEVSRITRGKIELRLAPVALDRVVRDAAELSKPLLATGRHELVLDLPALPCTVNGDAVRLTQVFANLLNNAAKFTPPKGRIEVALRSDGHTASVQVSDSGVGIPQAMLGSVFDMFVQVSDTSSAAQGGLGIGLTLVRSLVELHGGRVTASSAGINQGTTITVELALVSEEAAEVETPTLAAYGQAGLGHRALVVDDNRDAADSLAELLGLMGASSAVAYGVDEALAAMKACVPTIAFVDIGMPVRDGYELAALVRADSALADTVLVALTGWGQATDRDRIMATGFDHHLIKPAELAQLSALLEASHAGNTP
ncbi:hybrid sensor histidine kinase/response regulator [Hydrogenophaga sp.]|uniref:hybrid sensor histidine kinase/response regulator n=1 Tax=Hydrogenophaga sp. TaxID=1904254 RepID=UPI0025C32ABD|nr:hybrid sensor histidine kinase/response regulator [Hydrogenophaga sp.]